MLVKHPIELLLGEVLDASPDIEDLPGLVRAVLDQQDPASLRLLKAGVLLKAKERQMVGIRRAQKVKSKYPGPTPKALSMGGTALQKLIGLLEDAEAGRIEVNKSQWAKELKISRATLYRYLKSPGIVDALKTAKKAIGQGYQGREELKTQSVRLAAIRWERAAEDSGQSRSNRPIYEAEAAKRKERKKILLTPPKSLHRGSGG